MNGLQQQSKLFKNSTKVQQKSSSPRKELKILIKNQDKLLKI